MCGILISWFFCNNTTIRRSCCCSYMLSFSAAESRPCWSSTLMLSARGAFCGYLSDLYFALTLQELQTALVPAEDPLPSFMCTACWSRVNADSVPLEVPCLVALVSTAMVSTGTSGFVDGGLPVGVVMVMAFGQLAHSSPRGYGGSLRACA